jgi:hypothetical protein
MRLAKGNVRVPPVTTARRFGPTKRSQPGAACHARDRLWTRLPARCGLCRLVLGDTRDVVVHGGGCIHIPTARPLPPAYAQAQRNERALALAGRHDRAAENDAYVDITRTLRSIGLTGEVTYGLRAGRGFIFLFSGSIMARRPLYCIYRVRPSGA